MGYGNPGGKSVKSKVPNVPVRQPQGNNTITAKTTVTASSPIIKAAAPARATTLLNNIMRPDIVQSLINQPTRTPGGAGLSQSPNNPTKSNSPGFVSSFLTNAANNTYVSANAPGSTKMYSNVGGSTMGLLETASSFAKSTAGKQVIGGAVSAVTGGSKSQTGQSVGTTTRAVSPVTGRPYRRMNALNPRALSRATRRVSAFASRVKTVNKTLAKLAHKR